MGRIVLTCLNLVAESGWVGSIKDAIGPRLADTREKLAISEFVKFLEKKQVLTPAGK